LGRRRKRVLRIVKRTLPKVFSCPKCGVAAVRITSQSNNIHIACGNMDCRLTYTRESERPKEHIDIYNEFVDEFMAGRISG
jgi:transcription elongation factor Elf1